MKQNKILELVKGVQLIAERDEEGIYQLSINLGKKIIELKHESVVELYDWLEQEVLDRPSIRMSGEQAERITEAHMKAHLGQNTIASDDPLAARKATKGAFADPAALPLSKMGLKVENLNERLGNAKEAFSPEHIFDGGPGNK